MALTYDVSLSRLLRANAFTDADARQLSFETPILLPRVEASQVQQPGAEPQPAHVHTMEDAESIWDLAEHDRTGVSEMLALNRMPVEVAVSLKAGDRILVPSRTSLDERNSPSRIAYKRLAERLGLGTFKTAAELYRGRARRAWVLAAGPGQALDGTLRWPVEAGHFVRGYGSGPGHYHLVIDIAADIGEKVHCDPAPLLRPGIRYADGRVESTTTAFRWSPPSPRPPQVRCARRRHYPSDEEEQ